jgi:hypothetical protein
MKYTVMWKPEAERHLATIWSQTKDRNAVSKAAHVIDKLLGVNPKKLANRVRMDFGFSSSGRWVSRSPSNPMIERSS